MLFIVADSLRYDFARKDLFDKVFDTESHTKLEVDEYPTTSSSLPTLLLGEPYSVHGARIWMDPINIESGVIFDEYPSYATVSRLMGEGPFYQIPAKRQYPGIFKGIDCNAISDNDHYIFRTLSEGYDFLFYHSWITHAPFGIGNWCSKMNAELKDDDKLFEECTIQENKNRYEKGVFSMRERIKNLNAMTDETIVVTSDHGEYLGENGKHGHGVMFHNDSHKAISEVPLIVNRDVDLSDLSHQKDVKELVWAL